MAEPPIGANLRAALKERGWSYTRLIAEMRRVAAREGVSLPTTQSLVVMLSRWCNDHERPSEFYQSILSTALGRPPATLGFIEAPEPHPAKRTREHVRRGRHRRMGPAP